MRWTTCSKLVNQSRFNIVNMNGEIYVTILIQEPSLWQWLWESHMHGLDLKNKIACFTSCNECPFKTCLPYTAQIIKADKNGMWNDLHTCGCMPISISIGLSIMPPPIPSMPPKKPASNAIPGNSMNALGPIKSHSSCDFTVTHI